MDFTDKEKELIIEALDKYGDFIADHCGMTQAEDYWNIKERFMKRE